MTALAVILALLTGVLGGVSILLALEVRRLSARLQAFLDASEKAMASVVQDAREARLRWDRLSDQVEAAAAPLARAGALADRVAGDLEAARVQYREGLISASHLAGWAAGAFHLVQDLLELFENFLGLMGEMGAGPAVPALLQEREPEPALVIAHLSPGGPVGHLEVLGRLFQGACLVHQHEELEYADAEDRLAADFYP